MEAHPLDRVFAICSRPALAEKLGITLQAIVQWDEVPPKRAVAVSEITGIPLHELRPDVFPEPEKKAS